MSNEEFDYWYGSRYFASEDNRLWVADSPENCKLFVREFLETPAGQQIVSGGFKTQDNLEDILVVAQMQAGEEEISMHQFVAAAKRLFLAGSLTPKASAVEQAPVKKLSASQQAWSQYRQFTDSNSVAACKARAREDAGYATFLRKNMEREMNQPVGDAVENANVKAPATKKAVPQDVADYAARYRTMSSDAVRKEMSPGMNPLGPDAAKEATRLFEASCAAGLI